MMMVAMDRCYQIVLAAIASDASALALAPRTRLLDDFVGPEQQRRRNREAERFGRLEIDRQVVAPRLLHRKLRGLGALQDLVDHHGALAEHLLILGAVRDEAPRPNEIAQVIDRGYPG